KRRAREENRSPFTPSRLKRDAKRATRPKRKLNDRYTPTNYAQAIRRACEAAGVPHWSPNQIRHTKATEIRHEHGLEAAQVILGHSRIEATQIYAEKNPALAHRIALATG
ncbi:MAG: tyrosine-type recombinase/integrase, partial [Phycisphaerae bacterium]|nr:tyrosine-type recombinase/integrase [Phycisphaerae bacterium]